MIYKQKYIYAIKLIKYKDKYFKMKRTIKQISKKNDQNQKQFLVCEQKL